MRKMRKRTLSLLLTVLMLIMTACGRYEDSAPDTSPGYEAGTQTWDAQDSGEDVSAVTPENVPETPPEEALTVPPEEVSTNSPEDSSESPESEVAANLPTYGGYYYDLTNVVLYLEVYDELPPNYITKNEARELGWEGGSVEKYKEGAAIGGDSFGNREGLLPEADGRSYTECDIDTEGYNSRGSRRLVFSNDGLYFYTSDHYETFSEVTVTEDYEVIW